MFTEHTTLGTQNTLIGESIDGQDDEDNYFLLAM